MSYWPNPFVPTSYMVRETPPKVTPTGLIFPNGSPIYKVIYPEPIGFLHFPDPEEDGE